LRAVQSNDLAEAKRLKDRIYPTVRVFHAELVIDMHNRMKEALVLLGKLSRAVVRPPLVKLGGNEIAQVRCARIETRLLGENERRAAA
jgi:4-hydroxy-tetrahydrodipicolinate synthase